jgi:hypothetical protein
MRVFDQGEEGLEWWVGGLRILYVTGFFAAGAIMCWGGELVGALCVC